MRIPGTVNVSQAFLEEGREERALALCQSAYVLVEPLQQQRTPDGVGLPRPKAPDLGFLENIVATEELIRALAGQHHFVARLMHQPGQQEHRRGRGAHDRRLRVPDDFGKDLANLRVCRVNHLMFRSEVLRHRLLKLTLVVVGIAKRNREGRQTIRSVATDDCRDGRGIEPAAQVGTHRHIRPEANPRRINQQIPKLLHVFTVRPARSRTTRLVFHVETNGPVGRDLHLTLRRD